MRNINSLKNVPSHCHFQISFALATCQWLQIASVLTSQIWLGSAEEHMVEFWIKYTFKSINTTITIPESHCISSTVPSSFECLNSIFAFSSLKTVHQEMWISLHWCKNSNNNNKTHVISCFNILLNPLKGVCDERIFAHPLWSMTSPECVQTPSVTLNLL